MARAKRTVMQERAAKAAAARREIEKRRKSEFLSSIIYLSGKKNWRERRAYHFKRHVVMELERIRKQRAYERAKVMRHGNENIPYAVNKLMDDLLKDVSIVDFPDYLEVPPPPGPRARFQFTKLRRISYFAITDGEIEEMR